jgi:hypothetical protein
MQSSESDSSWLSLGQSSTIPSGPQLGFVMAPFVSLQQVTLARAQERASQPASET